jgi:acyl-CoA thioesterase FadM
MTTQILLVRDGERVAAGELRHVFVESKGDSTARIPESIRAGLARYQQAES